MINLTILLTGLGRGDGVIVAVRHIASKVVNPGCHYHDEDVGNVPVWGSKPYLYKQKPFLDKSEDVNDDKEDGDDDDITRIRSSRQQRPRETGQRKLR